MPFGLIDRAQLAERRRALKKPSLVWWNDTTHGTVLTFVDRYLADAERYYFGDVEPDYGRERIEKIAQMTGQIELIAVQCWRELVRNEFPFAHQDHVAALVVGTTGNPSDGHAAINAAIKLGLLKRQTEGRFTLLLAGKRLQNLPPVMADANLFDYVKRTVRDIVLKDAEPV